jgi:hypothetical protein
MSQGIIGRAIQQELLWQLIENGRRARYNNHKAAAR